MNLPSVELIALWRAVLLISATSMNKTCNPTATNDAKKKNGATLTKTSNIASNRAIATVMAAINGINLTIGFSL